MDKRSEGMADEWIERTAAGRERLEVRMKMEIESEETKVGIEGQNTTVADYHRRGPAGCRRG